MTIAADTAALNMRRAFADGLVDNYDKRASSKNHIEFKTRVQKS